MSAFDQVNIKLMQNKPITDEEEQIFIREMINSPDLYKYIAEHQDEYALFVFIPYMFGITYYGCKACMDKAVLIPCFHEEAYIHLKIFKEIFSKVRGMIFNAEPEKRLAESVIGIENVCSIVPGLGMDTDLSFDAQRFREKYQIQGPFILYAGRKDVGKNIYALIRYFREFKMRNEVDLKLVLIGGGKVNIPEDISSDVYDLGFVDMQDKYDAYGAATVLCQPSKHESFSYVIMESWLCERPVMVHEECDVTKDFVVRSNGGLYFKNYFEFEENIKFYLKNPQKASVMGCQGKKFVLENFKWDIVMKKYIDFFNEITIDA